MDLLAGYGSDGSSDDDAAPTSTTSTTSSSSSSSSSSASASASRPVTSTFKGKPCFDFQKGKCTRGDRCKFSHAPKLLKRRVQSAPAVDTFLRSSRHGSSIVPKMQGGDQMVNYNPSVETMYAPVQGPVHPHRKTAAKGPGQNTLTGRLEAYHTEDFLFEQQHHTFQNYGYAQDPTAGSQYMVGNQRAAMAMGGDTVFNASTASKQAVLQGTLAKPGPEWGDRRKRKRTEKGGEKGEKGKGGEKKCFDFQKGSCTRGDACRFSHGGDGEEGKGSDGEGGEGGDVDVDAEEEAEVAVAVLGDAEAAEEAAEEAKAKREQKAREAAMDLGNEFDHGPWAPMPVDQTKISTLEKDELTDEMKHHIAQLKVRARVAVLLASVVWFVCVWCVGFEGKVASQ